MSEWRNESGEIVHPDAPRGRGGPGHFRLHSVTGTGHNSPGIPAPGSPAGRHFDFEEKHKVALSRSGGHAGAKHLRPKLSHHSKKQVKKLREQAASILDGIRIAISANPSASQGGESHPTVDPPGRGSSNEVMDRLDELFEQLGEEVLKFSFSAHFSMERIVKMGKQFERLEGLLLAVVSRMAGADVRMGELRSFWNKLVPPEKWLKTQVYTRVEMDYVKRELDGLEREYLALMRKALAQHPSGAQIGKFLAEHLKSLESVEEHLPWVDAVFASGHFGWDLGRGDLQGAAVEGTLAVLAAMIILFMAPEVFVVFFFAEPYLKFVERSIKEGPPEWERVLAARGYNPNQPPPNWEDYLREHIRTKAK